MLLGRLPLTGAPLRVGPLTVPLTPEAFEEWAGHLPRAPVPVMVDHDPNRCVGWATKATFGRDHALLWGELDPDLTDTRTVTRLIRSRMMDGLSPYLSPYETDAHYYKAMGRYGRGVATDVKELSVVWQPRLPGARWLGV